MSLKEPPRGDNRDGMTILKFGEGGLGSAKWWNFMPMAMRALHITAFIKRIKRRMKILHIYVCNLSQAIEDILLISTAGTQDPPVEDRHATRLLSHDRYAHEGETSQY